MTPTVSGAYCLWVGAGQPLRSGPLISFMGCRVHHTPLPPPPHPDHIIYHLPVACVCLSVAQISLSMVFIFRLSSRRDLCSGGGGIHVVQLCHACWINLAVTETQAWVFWVLLPIYPLAAYILSWCRQPAGSISCIFLGIFLCQFAVLTRCGFGFNWVPGSVSGSWFAIRNRIQEGKNNPQK
jgi:hypothetical protein